MKLTFLLTLLGTLGITLATSYSQQTKLTLSVEDAKIKDLLQEIKDKSDFSFWYNNNELDDEQRITVFAREQTIDKILDVALRNQNLSYEIHDRFIVIFKPETNNSANKTGLNQQITIKGKITDSNGNALPGVNVIEKGTTNGSITNLDGEYSISVRSPEAILIFSYVGFLSEELEVGEKTSINVTLIEDIQSLDEVVVVGYGKQRKGNLTGSIASIKTEELTIAPAASTINMLAGRLPGLISYQSSGQPGSDQASISIRGFGEAIWIVDGIEADFNNLDPNQIESISILKDGSASIYGARAGNGVILVTTKRGTIQKPVISINSSYTLQGITTMTRPVNSGQYAELENEKRINQGLDALYTEEQVQKYYDGTDPQYPNTDWFKETINTWAPMHQQNISIRGGSEKIKYYGFFGYLDQETFWKKNGGNYERYNLQSNIDAQVTKNLSIQLDIASVIENSIFPWRPQSAGINTLWQDLWNSLPIYPATLPDPTKYSYANGQGVGSIKLISDYDIAGYSKTNNQNIRGTFVAKYNFNSIKGLNAKAFINYDQNYFKAKSFTKPYEFYTYDYTSDIYTLAGALGTQAKLDMARNDYRNITSQLSLNYDNTIGTDHHISALALYEFINYYSENLSAGRDEYLTSTIEQLFAGASETSIADGSESEMGRVSYVGRLNYSYKDKYLIETTIRADASAKFSTAQRWGYFPSVSLGWRVNQEGFLVGNSNIDDLKIRLSYGSSGNDNVGNFQYLSGYQYNGQWLIGSSTQKGITSTGLTNPYLTWENIKIYNIGTDFSFWNWKLFGTGEVFYRTISGIPATRIQSLPSTFGANLPEENINSQNSRGFELNLGTRGNLNQLNFEISGNISWARAKWDHYEEQDYTDPDQIRINKLSGKWTDIWYGYEADGLFTSQDEIDNLGFTYPAGNNGLNPGDIKYVDTNNDGVLDWKDQAEIGKGTSPHWMVGGSLKLNYKNFDLSALLQGSFGYYNYVQLQHGGINYSKILYDLRWSEKNNSADAFVPRLGGASSNDYISNHYFKKTAYLRLKTMTVGYTVTNNFLNKYNFQQLRLYLAGTNLLTYNKLKDFDLDPEAPSGNAGYYYPQQRTVTLGINLSF